MISNLNPTNGNSLNSFRFAVKNIGGRFFRINNLLNIAPNNESINDSQQQDKSLNIREFKLVNRLNRKISAVLSDDDATSEEELSRNISFIEDDDDDEISLEHNQSKHFEVDIEDLNSEGVDIDNLMLFEEKQNKGQRIMMKPTKHIKRFKWTHFLSIPFHTNKEFLDKFEFFRKNIIEENFSDIEENIFQNPRRLHMTVCLFQINDKKQLELLQKTLREETVLKFYLRAMPYI